MSWTKKQLLDAAFTEIGLQNYAYDMEPEDAQSAITTMDAMKVGVSAWRLGAGRSKQGEQVQAGAGIELHAKPGDYIAACAPLMTLHTDEPERFARALEILEGAVTIVEGGTVNRLPLVLERITG